MACTKPWIVGVRVEPGYSCIIDRLKILRDSGGFFCEEILFSTFGNENNATQQKFGKQTRLSAYTYFLFVSVMFFHDF